MTTPLTLNFDEEGPATHSAGEKPFDDVVLKLTGNLNVKSAAGPSKEKAATNLIDKLTADLCKELGSLYQSRFPPRAVQTPATKRISLTKTPQLMLRARRQAKKDPILAVSVASVGPSPCG
ncbi:hypothetical protein E4U61_005554 [Claviceps capensis]|nr:hypothetical protein E4U61_005554 [Claviceps capensis]